MARKEKMAERIPPYLTYATWKKLLAGLKTYFPPRLDRSYYDRLGFSGSQIYAAKSALAYLGLMDSNNVPRERLRELVQTEGDEHKRILREIIETAYQPLFEESPPSEATSGQIEEYFKKCGAKGGVVVSCVSFFLAVARESGIELSPHLSGQIKARAPRRRLQRRDAKGGEAKPPSGTGLLTMSGVPVEVISYVAELPEDKQDSFIKAYIKIRRALKDEETKA